MTRIFCLVALALTLRALPVCAQAAIPSPTVKQFNDGEHWVVAEALTYQIGDSPYRITVPAGFVTDFASIPRYFHALLKPSDRPGRAGIVHDFLYWEQACTREQADWILLLAMMESGVDAVTRNLVYRVVDWFGATAWETNQQERSAGFPRVIPPASMNLPALALWPTYRRQLFQQGIRPEAKPAATPVYCAAAKTIKVAVPNW